MGMFDKMKDAKNMYSNIKKAQNEINKIKVEGSAGAGAVRVTVKGNHQVVSIEIDNDTHTGNKKILEDYLVAVELSPKAAPHLYSRACQASAHICDANSPC